MKNYILLLLTLASLVANSKKSYNEPWLQIGYGVNYKGFVGVQAHLYGKSDLMRLSKQGVRFSIFNRTGFGFGAWGLALQSNSTLMFQVRVCDNFKEKIGFNYAYGYSTNKIKGPHEIEKFWGFGTHQIGISIPHEGDFYISFQACKYFWQSIMTLEIGLTDTIKLKRKRKY